MYVDLSMNVSHKTLTLVDRKEGVERAMLDLHGHVYIIFTNVCIYICMDHEAMTARYCVPWISSGGGQRCHLVLQ